MNNSGLVKLIRDCYTSTIPGNLRTYCDIKLTSRPVTNVLRETYNAGLTMEMPGNLRTYCDIRLTSIPLIKPSSFISPQRTHTAYKSIFPLTASELISAPVITVFKSKPKAPTVGLRYPFLVRLELLSCSSVNQPQNAQPSLLSCPPSPTTCRVISATATGHSGYPL